MPGQFSSALLHRIDAAIPRISDRWRTSSGARDDHRQVMIDAMTLIVAFAHPHSTHHGETRLVPAVEAAVEALSGLQDAGGLFGGGDNHLSPPDTSFTINDACLSRRIASGMPELDAATEMLEGIILTAYPALIAGGVHTPNHRWELAAALARTADLSPNTAATARIEEWLSEGIDITADGMYSERSAIYAGAVTNDSLITLATHLARPELLDVVRRNLDAFVPLLDEDGDVEAVHSRRQDQWMRMSAGHFAMQLRRFAICDGRGDFAWWADRLTPRIERAERALADVMLEPELDADLPPLVPPPAHATTVLEESGLARISRPGWQATVFGGSDYSRTRRVASGLSTNPTFLRMRSGAAVLSDVRLSTRFFDLGAFRPEGLRRDGRDRFVLTERMSARYYQPLNRDLRRLDGEYPLVSDGRFFASMDFESRAAEVSELVIAVMVHLVDGGVDLRITTEGARADLSLEFTFRPGGKLLGADATDDPTEHLATDGLFTYGLEHAGLSVELSGVASGDAALARYEPGEAYSYLGGTNRTAGIHVSARLAGPVDARVRLRAIS